MSREEYEIYIDMENELNDFNSLLVYIKRNFPNLKIQMKYPEQNVIEFMFLGHEGFCFLNNKKFIIKFFLDFNLSEFTSKFKQLVSHRYFEGKRLRGFLSSNRGYDDELNLENEFEYFDSVYPINIFNHLDYKNIDENKLHNILDLTKGKINDVYFESKGNYFILLKLEKKNFLFHFYKDEVLILRNILLKSNK